MRSTRDEVSAIATFAAFLKSLELNFLAANVNAKSALASLSIRILT